MLIGRSVVRSVGKYANVGRSVDRSIGRSVCRSVTVRVGRSVCRSIGRSVGRSCRSVVFRPSVNVYLVIALALCINGRYVGRSKLDAWYEWTVRRKSAGVSGTRRVSVTATSDGRTNGRRTNGRTDERTEGRTDGRKDGNTDGQMDGLTDENRNRSIDPPTDRRPTYGPTY